MSHFFLLNETLDTVDFQLFKSGMIKLIEIDKDEQDIFLKHDSLYNLRIIQNELYQNFGQEEQAIYIFMEQLQISLAYCEDEEMLDTNYPDTSNAFLGIEFSHTAINAKRQITDSISYHTFRQGVVWDFSFRTFWEKRNDLFPDLIFCGAVEAQIATIGDSTIFNQAIDRLTALDSVAKNWSSGNFSYKKINRDYPLRISPESDQTLKRYSNERTFSLPDGRREVFDLHVKTGVLRFHFYPDNQIKKIYVGYIGPHLTTVSN